MNYPDIETDDSAYRAAVRYDCVEGFLIFAGGHQTFHAARLRATKCATALRTAGETGIIAWITFSGQKPHGFPRNGVQA